MGEIFRVETRSGQEAVDITARVQEVVAGAGVAEGFCHVMVLHSTAAIVINETADPNIGRDLITALDRTAPDGGGWLHDQIDDNAHSHIKASILGPSELVPVQNGELLLGTWQGIYLLEFDGPRKRRVSVQFMTGSRS